MRSVQENRHQWPCRHRAAGLSAELWADQTHARTCSTQHANFVHEHFTIWDHWCLAIVCSHTVLQSYKPWHFWAFWALNGLSLPYIDQLVQVADLPGRRRLCSSSSHRLQVPTYRLATVGRRSLPVAASILWNILPPDIHSSASLTDFSQTKDIHAPPIISRHFALTIHTSTSLSWTL